MAKRKGIMKVLPDAIEENEAILRGLRTRNIVDNRTSQDLNKLFNTLNGKIRDTIGNFKNNENSTEPLKAVEDTEYGPIEGCPSGSWWGIRMDCSRHRVHIPFNIDIHDAPFGATSICLSNTSSNVDADHGDLVTFTGREFVEGVLKNESLVLNYRNRIPLRVIRNYSLTNKYAPKTGLRYDGLYTVVTHWIGISKDAKKRHKFALLRISNQEPPPWLNDISSLKDPVVDFAKAPTNSATTKWSNINKKRLQKEINDIPKKRKVESSSQCDTSCTYSQVLIKKAQKIADGNLTESITPVALSCQNFVPNNCHAKLQNTNISIRTDLYSSTPVLNQQESKKPIQTSFCKALKPSRSTELLTSKNVSEVDKEEQTQISVNRPESRNGKSHIYTRHKFSQNKMEFIQKDSNGSNKLDNVGSFNVRMNKCIRISDNNLVENPIVTNKISSRIIGVRDLMHKQNEQATMKNKQIQEQACGNGSKETTNNITSNSLDTLTPDKILNLVTNDKRHPMAKLLIQNMIGVSIEETKVLKAYETLALSKEDGLKKRNVDKTEGKCVDQKKKETQQKEQTKMMITRMSLRNMSKRIKNHSLDICSLKRRSLRHRSEVQNIENKTHHDRNVQKNNVKISESGRSVKKTVAKKSTVTERSKRVFPSQKSRMVLRKDKKSHFVSRSQKKQVSSKSEVSRKLGREISNLVINARLSPITRGPRNRRLRHSIQCNGLAKSVKFPQKCVIKRVSKTELSRKRLRNGIMKACRMLPQNVKRHKSKNTAKPVKMEQIMKESNRPKMADAVTQCNLFSRPSVDCSLQTDLDMDDIFDSSMKMEMIDLEDVKSEPEEEEEEDGEDDEEEEDGDEEVDNDDNNEDDHEEDGEELLEIRDSNTFINYVNVDTPSAFAPVDKVGNNLKIARLRSIGFRPIESSDSETSMMKKDINEEYIKYITEENNVVGYMDEELHYQDIENEDGSLSSMSMLKHDVNREHYPKLKTYYSIKPIESTSTKLPEGDMKESTVFVDDSDKPWHGWKKVSYNNKIFWMGW